MAEKLIGSLIYGDHPEPKKSRPWKDRLKVPVSIAAVLLVIGGVAYKYANYREEGRAEEFLQAVLAGRYDDAYAMWDAQSNYTMTDFLADWGKEGYYTKGASGAEVIDSNTSGLVVIVYVRVDGFDAPVALRVDKETLRLSFSPVNKYRQ